MPGVFRAHMKQEEDGEIRLIENLKITYMHFQRIKSFFVSL